MVGILSILALLFIVNKFASFYLENIIKENLETKNPSLSGITYSLEIEDWNIDLVRGNLQAKNISLKPLKTISHSALNDDTAAYILDITISSVKFTGLRYHFLSQKKVTCDGLNIDGICCEIKHYPKDKEDTSTKKIETNPYHLIEPYLEELNVKKLKTSNGQLQYFRFEKSDTMQFTLNNLSLQADRFSINKDWQRGIKKTLLCDNIKLELEKFSHSLPDEDYTFHCESASINTSDSSLRIEGLHIEPVHSKMDFARLSSKNSDWSELKLEEIKLIGIHYHKNIIESVFFADSVYINRLEYQNFKNQNVASIRKLSSILYKSLQRAPVKMGIDRIRVDNSSVVYEELPRAKNEAGIIKFTDINANISNLTNIASENTINILAQGKFMDMGLIDAEFNFPTNSLTDIFSIKGTLGGMNLIGINDIIEPLVSCRIENGQLHRVDFDIVGSDDSAYIDMLVLYSKLEVVLLKSINNKNYPQRFVSGFLNKLLLPQDNPTEGCSIQTVRRVTYRNKYSSTFNYLWKIVFGGLCETIGLSEQKQQYLQNLAKEVKEIKENTEKIKQKKNAIGKRR
ncbi:hypothetical protein AwDysgo_03200 [Bacteroidales bacterium]|nr:hypothetical protein AwDysgo_03200 [Bacteroidales bacterium]